VLASSSRQEAPVKLMVEYPIRSDDHDGAWVRPDNMTEFARVAEQAGVDAISLTDHPAPSKKWLTRGGHETLDPFAGLSYFAAVTSRLRLMTYLVVVPYRNPLLLAKCMTSLDVVSGGRATFVLGAGYLRSEFGALGVEFEERNKLFDEAVDVLRGVWATDSFEFAGGHFTARGQVIAPGPVQRPHPPLWVGGNSALSRERVARWGQGWAPMQASPEFASVTRTASINSDHALREAIADLAARLEKHGRSLADIDLVAWAEPWGAKSRDAYVNRIGELRELGTTWISLGIDTSSFGAALDDLRGWGEVRHSLE
jgi:probable F420-dependent oxidoreductase